MSRDVNLVAVRAEKKGRPINRPGHREREQWAAMRRRAPTAAEPRIPNVHVQTCTHIHMRSLSAAVWKGGQLSRCSATGFTKGTNDQWKKKKKKEKREKGEKLPHFLLRCWVSTQSRCLLCVSFNICELITWMFKVSFIRNGKHKWPHRYFFYLKLFPLTEGCFTQPTSY